MDKAASKQASNGKQQAGRAIPSSDSKQLARQHVVATMDNSASKQQ